MLFLDRATVLAPWRNSLTWSGGVKIGLAQASGDISIVGGGGTVVTDAIASAFTAPAYSQSHF